MNCSKNEPGIIERAAHSDLLGEWEFKRADYFSHNNQKTSLTFTWGYICSIKAHKKHKGYLVTFTKDEIISEISSDKEAYRGSCSIEKTWFSYKAEQKNDSVISIKSTKKRAETEMHDFTSNNLITIKEDKKHEIQHSQLVVFRDSIKVYYSMQGDEGNLFAPKNNGEENHNNEIIITLEKTQ
tara:strand:- start:397 stop:945 length:549 start_codon:yes stop_codon:yes gene_type:complete